MLLPGALASQKDCGIPASFTLAEAALESGWGSSLLALQAKNLFGVKADRSWKGPVWTMNTREFTKYNGWVMVPADWRSYATWADCISDHAAFLRSNSRYSSAFNFTTGKAFAVEVAKAGYATDPNYATKISAVIDSHNLSQYDT